MYIFNSLNGQKLKFLQMQFTYNMSTQKLYNYLINVLSQTVEISAFQNNNVTITKAFL